MDTNPPQGDARVLMALVQTKMPFGKYKGTLICDLPDAYLEWMSLKGFPKGGIGIQLQAMHEIALNGLRPLLHPLRGRG